MIYLSTAVLLAVVFMLYYVMSSNVMQCNLMFVSMYLYVVGIIANPPPPHTTHPLYYLYIYTLMHPVSVVNHDK